MQELKTEDSIIKNGDVTHTFNHHEKLNDFLQKLALKVKTIIPDASNTVDFDNVITDNEKYDATRTYNLPAGSYALPKFFESLIHKHLLHGITVDSPAKQF